MTVFGSFPPLKIPIVPPLTANAKQPSNSPTLQLPARYPHFSARQSSEFLLQTLSLVTKYSSTLPYPTHSPSVPPRPTHLPIFPDCTVHSILFAPPQYSRFLDFSKTYNTFQARASTNLTYFTIHFLSEARKVDCEYVILVDTF